jgi:hypothetical protein
MENDNVLHWTESLKVLMGLISDFRIHLGVKVSQKRTAIASEYETRFRA